MELFIGKGAEFIRGTRDGEVKAELARELGLELASFILADLRVSEILLVAQGERKVVGNPTTGGKMVHYTIDANAPHNGHDRI